MRYGSLFSGVGGLDMAIEQVFPDATPAWLAEFDPAPSRVLARRWPGVPNLGDVTKVDWASLEPVDLICGGSPCQDVSTAGRRAGMVEGTRSNLWVAMREAVAVLRPKIVVWENVRGAASAYAVSDVESEEGLLGESYGPDRPALRALGRVLGDLSDLGFDAEWRGVRASDLGACHHRFRIFVVAWRRDLADTEGLGWSDGVAQDDGPLGGEGNAFGDEGRLRPAVVLPTPVAQPSGNSPEDHLRKKPGRTVVTDLAIIAENGLWETGGMLPTQRTSDTNGPGVHGSGGLDLRTVVDVLPTPNASVRSGQPHEKREGHQLLLSDVAEHTPDWGKYAPAIRRHEVMVGRPAPAPTQPSKTGKPQLSPRFTEWMMGWPEGWVTECGLSRNEALKACGNGVVPQQAAWAIRECLKWKGDSDE